MSHRHTRYSFCHWTVRRNVGRENQPRKQQHEPTLGVADVIVSPFKHRHKMIQPPYIFQGKKLSKKSPFQQIINNRFCPFFSFGAQ